MPTYITRSQILGKKLKTASTELSTHSLGLFFTMLATCVPDRRSAYDVLFMTTVIHNQADSFFNRRVRLALCKRYHNLEQRTV